MTLKFSPLLAVVTTYTQAKIKVEGHLVEWKQTDGRTDGADCITFVANAVGNDVSYDGHLL